MLTAELKALLLKHKIKHFGGKKMGIYYQIFGLSVRRKIVFSPRNVVL